MDIKRKRPFSAASQDSSIVQEDTELQDVKNKIRAVEFCLKGSDLATASADIQDHLPIYTGRPENFLLSMLDNLQKEKLALLTIKCKMTVTEGMLRMKPCLKHPIALLIRCHSLLSMSPDHTEPTGVDDFSSVWTAIVNGHIIENEKNERLWSLYDGVNRIKWVGDIEELYNRECYDDITTQLSNLTRVLVYGTPGVGKTLYLQAFLVNLVRQAREKN